MQTYYFTFGISPDFPYQDGWIEIQAPTMGQAMITFSKKYPHPKHNVLNCAFIYDERQFRATRMYKEGNFGRRCHETIRWGESE